MSSGLPCRGMSNDDAAHPPAPPDRLGRRRFLTAAAAGAGVAAGAGGLALTDSGSVAASSLPPRASRFVPLPRQVRIADTRIPGRHPVGLLDDGIRVQVAGRDDIPEEATAAVLTVTAVNASAGNFVSVFPSGSPRPTVSTLNMSVPGEVAANLATVRIGDDGSVDITAFAPSELIVDVAGYYEPVVGPVREGRFTVLPTAVRAIDTRSRPTPGPQEIVEVFLPESVPASATSAAINLTTTGTLGWGYFTCFPLDESTPPETSNLNVNGAGETRASAAIVKVTTDARGRRGFKVFTFGGGHVIVDVAGWFTGPSDPPSSDGLFVPVDPVRLLDTRQPGQMGRLWHGWVAPAAVPGMAATGAQAVVGNVTAVDAREPGFFTVFPAGTLRNDVSNLNTDRGGQTIANHVITRISTAGLMVYAQTGAHVLFDLTGWYIGRPSSAPLRLTNPAPPPAAPPWTVEVPALPTRRGGRGWSSRVLAGRADPIVDSGRTWHWTGTGFVGQVSNIGLFAHRTEAGAPLYYMHELRRGDEILVTVADRPGDRRRFRYRVVRTDMVLDVRASTRENSRRILAATRLHPGATISLIGCALADGLPTSLDHRIIVTAEFVDWTEI